MPLSGGTRLGSYEILNAIGAGGMGEVYRARDLRLGREVAIKVLPSERLADDSRRRRFVQEAQAASALNHPHIVTIHEIESAGDIDFIVMEYVRGRSLDAAIPRGGLRLGELLRIAIPVADALAAAHARGIVHRDLKPANVIVGSDGTVKVVDFGLAKLIDREAAPEDETLAHRVVDAGLSAAGTIVGTAAYMAPEQAVGGTVDARSDIFSFGALVYEMATGTRAFPGSSVADTLTAVVRAQPTPPTQVVPSLPRELERLILRCLRREPERRYQTIRDIALELQDIKDESDSGTLTQAAPVARRSRIVVPVIATGILLAAAVAMWAVWRRPDAPVLPPTLVPLTTFQGFEFSPTFSPDGEQVAFQWNGEKEDNWDIYLKLVGSSDVRRLTQDRAEDHSPRWSPDGRQIVFLRDSAEGVAIYAMSPVTGTERKLSERRPLSMTGWSWSPDGRWLVASYRTEKESGISLIPGEGGEWRPLVRATAPPVYGSPAFSPDRRQLAYVVCAAITNCELQVLSLTAGLDVIEPARTVVKRAGNNLGGVCWSRDGRFLLYVTEPVAFATRLWRVPVDGSAAPEPVDLAGIGVVGPTVARTRDRLAFSQQRSRVSLHPLDSSFTSPAVLASSFWDFDAQFSPDGRQIVFSSSRSGQAVEIWLAGADGSAARQLTRGPGRWQGSPGWSPDGRQIAFDSQQEDGHWQIWVVDADGGAPRQITTGAANHNMPTWSPDGKWIYFTSIDETAGVSRVPASGGVIERITPGAGRYGRPVVSSDGKEILYGAELWKPSALLAISSAGGPPREVLPCVTVYAATSAALYYVECGPGPERNVHAIHVATAKDRVLGRTRDVAGSGSRITVSPDDTTVLVQRETRTADLMLVENFR